MLLSHPLEFDGVSAQFFTVLAKENKKDMQSCRVQCPPTVLFEQGFAKAGFATETSAKSDVVGELKRKPGKEIELQELFAQLVRNTVDGDIVAVLLYAAPRVNEMNHVRFMDRTDLRNFLFHEIEKPRSLLQKFVKPKGSSNTLIHAIWSPLMILAEGRRNKHSLKDRHLPADVRGMTFEAAGVDTTEVVVAQAVVKDITNVCKTIAEHFDKTERLTVNRLGAFFKVDENNRLQLLFATSLRVQDAVTGRNAAPINLAHAIMTPTKVNLNKDESSTQSFLDETDRKEAMLKVSIPSMPDTSTLLLQSIHRSMRRARNQSPSSRSPSPSQRSPMVSPRSKQGPVSPRPTGQKRTLSPINARTPPPGAHTVTSPQQQRQAPPRSITPTALKATNNTVSPASPTVRDKEITVGPGAPLPQPRPLLKYQHLLPNSEANMTQNTRKVELGMTEADIKLEWENFLAQQQRQIAMIRASELEKNDLLAAAEAVGNKTGIAHASRDLVSPPVRATAVFAGLHRVNPSHSSTNTTPALDPGATPSQSISAAKSPSHNHTRDSATPVNSNLPLGGDKAAFIAAWKSAHAEKTSQETFDPHTSPLFPEESRESQIRNAGFNVRVPQGAGFPHRSVVLPPHFAAAATHAGSPVSMRKAKPHGIEYAAAQHRKNHPEKEPPANPTPVSLGAKVAVGSQPVTPVKSTTRTPTALGHTDKSPSASPGIVGSTPGAAKHAHLALNNTTSSPHGSPSQSFEASSNFAGSRPVPGKTSAQATPPRSPRRSATPAITLQPRQLAAALNTTPSKMLLRLRSQATARDALLTEGLSDEQLAQVSTRVEELCDAFRQYIRELHYALYCYFLESTNSDAYIEVPEMFRCCATTSNMCKLLHRLHGHIVNRGEYLTETATVESPLILRETLLRRLHAGALSSFPPPACNDESEVVELGDAIIVPRFQGRFIVLKGEDSAAFDNDDLRAFTAAPDGVIYDAAYRHCLYAYLAELEGTRELQERIRRADEASAARAAEEQLHARAVDEPNSPHMMSSDRLESDLGATQQMGQSTLVSFATKGSLQARELFCYKCQTCSMCCVCSIIRRASPLRFSSGAGK